MKIALSPGIMSASAKSRPIKGQEGFSMAEMMVVIAVFGVLTAIAVPAYLQQLPDRRLRSAARDIKSDFEALKLRAIRENADAVIWFDTNNDMYRAYLDEDGDRNQDGTEPTIVERQMPAGIDMYQTVFTSWSNQTFFDGRGLPDRGTGNGGYVCMVNSNNNYRRVVLFVVGLVKIQTSTDGGTWVDES